MLLTVVTSANKISSTFADHMRANKARAASKLRWKNNSGSEVPMLEAIANRSAFFSGDSLKLIVPKMELKRKFTPSNLKLTVVILTSVLVILLGEQTIIESAPLEKSVDENPKNATVAALQDSDTPAESAQTNEKTKVSISQPNQGSFWTDLQDYLQRLLITHRNICASLDT